MKKKNISHYIAPVLSAVLLLSSCTDAFEDMNTDSNGVTNEELTQDFNYIGAHFPSIQKSIYYNPGGYGWDFQTAQNLTFDIWSGYMATPSYFLDGNDTQTNVTPHEWTDSYWSNMYDAVMIDQLKVVEKCEELGMETYAHFNAINTVLRILGMHNVVDGYGPIIYSKYGDTKLGGEYDAAEDVYKQFFTELKDASDALYAATQTEVASFAAFDAYYGGDLSKWLRLCNTLRLRLAMRIVKYDANWAKTEGEAAISAPGGLLQSGDGCYVSGFEWKHPLYTCSIEYNDMFISADTKSILGGYSDPRLAKFGSAKKLTMVDGTSSSEILGIRRGISDLNTLADRYKAVVANVNVVEDTPGLIMSSSEAYFLLAEAALRGWNVSSTAQSYYEEGVRASFSEWGVSGVDTYLQSHAAPADYVDPLSVVANDGTDASKKAVELGKVNSRVAASTVTPCWADATTKEEQLEKIITQKWIAGFPEGKNAWAEWRRTGYPKLMMPRVNNNADITNLEAGVRRMPFILDEINNNPEGYAQAVQLLGGPDTGATRIFWDKDAPNF